MAVWAKSAKLIENHLNLVIIRKWGKINYNFKFHMGIQFSTKILIAIQNYECILARGGKIW